MVGDDDQTRPGESREQDTAVGDAETRPNTADRPTPQTVRVSLTGPTAQYDSRTRVVIAESLAASDGPPDPQPPAGEPNAPNDEPREHTVLIDVAAVAAPIDLSRTATLPIPGEAQLAKTAEVPLPAFAPEGSDVVDSDEEEKQLHAEKRFGALLELYRLRLADAPTKAARAALHRKIATLHEQQDLDLEAAFNALVEGFDHAPGDDDLVRAVETLAKKLGRMQILVDRAIENFERADGADEVALLGHLVYWHERVLGKADAVEPFASALEELDRTHPVVLKREAKAAASKGDPKLERQLLLRALERTTRPDERVDLHVVLGDAAPNDAEATQHYEAALAITTNQWAALSGLERVALRKNDHALLERILERQVASAPSDAIRAATLVRIADLYETKHLNRDRAARALEQALELEPENVVALSALERCYHALRDWPRLVSVLRRRAEATLDAKTKIAAFERIAEVQESKLSDPLATIDAHEAILVVDPKDRQALANLGRLFEKIGNYESVAEYRGRLALLAPSPRETAQQLVQIGDYLALPGRDPARARAFYEKATAIDGSNASAWEALERLASAVDDRTGAIASLAQRAQNTEGARQRAHLYVELAKERAARDDSAGAEEAYETALASDPANVAACAALIETYLHEQRWSEAATVSDVLLAATGENDPKKLAWLRAQVRIFSALENHERALRAAVDVLDTLAAGGQSSSEASERGDLLVAYEAALTASVDVSRAKAWLARISAERDVLRSNALVTLARIQRAEGAIDHAVGTLEEAVASSTADGTRFRELADLYLAQGDFARASKLRLDVARGLPLEERVGELLVVAELWANSAGEREKAVDLLEEARTLAPSDRRVLHALLDLHAKLEKWEQVVAILVELESVQDTTEGRTKNLFALALVLQDKVSDPIRAAEVLDRILDLDKNKLEAFERLVRVLTEAKDWQGLERYYRKMIARVKDDNATLAFALFYQLGLVYRDRLGDTSKAYDAFTAAGRIRPDDVEVRKILTELLVVTDNVDNAVANTRERIEHAPFDPELYAELYELFLRQHEFDKAWCTVDALSTLRPLTPEQQTFYDDYPPPLLRDVPGRLIDDAWRSHVFHPDLDPALTRVFAWMAPIVLRMRHAQRPDLAPREFTAEDSDLFAETKQAFADGAEILAFPRPRLFVGDPSAAMPFAPGLVPGSVLVSIPALEARTESIVYAVGQRLAESRVELAARALFPSLPDLTALLAAAVRVGMNERATEASSIALDLAITSTMTTEEHEGIRAAVLAVREAGGFVDVKRWLQAADLSSARAALLLSGTVASGRRMIASAPVSAADLPPRERIAELCRFAISDAYAELRDAIGISVTPD